MVVRQRARPCRQRQGALSWCLLCVLLAIGSRAFVAAPQRAVPFRNHVPADQRQHSAAQAVLLASAVPEVARAADSLDEALHPWFSIAPIYGGILYIIALVVQRVKWEWYNYVYVGAATLWLGPEGE
ncbi:unnamed protein product [Durusdinium trenchii]|uniref:Uncharacterized protein n=1 Tax=Durusdinium trenchii TaxID=1381693 RepID=A0ABP0STU8_9DINO